MTEVVCASCKKLERIYAKGMCVKCYRKTDNYKNYQRNYRKTDKYKINNKGYQKTYHKKDKYSLAQIRWYFRKLSPESKKMILAELKMMDKKARNK